MNRLAVFDIDGTLTDTNEVDDFCFVQAAADILGVHASSIDWSSCPHITDSGILDWLFVRHRGRSPEAEEIDATCDRFCDLLRAQSGLTPERFAPIPGSLSALSFLAATWDITFATGGWQASAHLKLNHIGIHADSYSFASGSDATSRADIVQLAIRRAELQHGKSYARIVVAGDAPWDVQTAIELQLPFVGIGTGQRAARLRETGAMTVLPNYLDQQAVAQAFDAARVPAPQHDVAE
jgi:phosphoglycolate phosphatase-like HAD superfamily hydrolase